MPYKDIHACRLRDPDEFQPPSFRVVTKGQPKGIQLVIARPKGKKSTAAQSVHYKTEVWDEDDARLDCGERGGTFEPASEESSESATFKEASYQDILGLLLDDRLEEDYMSLYPDLQEAELSYSDKQCILRAAVYAAFGKGNDRYYLWIQDVWDKYLVYEDSEDGKYYKVDYVMNDDGEVTLGEPKEVIRKTIYEPVKEAATVKSQIQGLLKNADSLLKTKNLPAKVVSNVKAMRNALTKTWEELTKDDSGADGDSSPTPATSPAPATESISEATKTEDGEAFTASDYAYVPDPEKPSTWKLRLTAEPGGSPDSGIVGAAIAAIGKGFRGNKVEIPADDLSAVKSKIRTAWKKANPDKESDEMPDEIKEAIGDMIDLDMNRDFIALVEATKNDITKIKVIEPGWGSSGYYSEEVLSQAAGNYRTGTKMYWDHPTKSDESERPERSLRDLAGVLVSDGVYDPSGPEGPGIYADAAVFGGYKDLIQEIGPHIGISHRAMGRAKVGEADGRKGNIIEQISQVHSVDFVTSPGAGGKVLQLFESAKGANLAALSNVGGKEEYQMSDAEKQELDELRGKATRLEEVEKENQRLLEAQIFQEAEKFVVLVVSESKPQLPELTQKRITEALVKSPVVVDGKIDERAYRTKIEEAIKDEIEYLSKVAPSGVITGMGRGLKESGDPEKDKAALKQTFKEAYMREGKSPEEAERMAEISAAGR